MNRIGKLETGFIELITESKRTVKDCSKLVEDLEIAKGEIGKAFEMLLAILVRLYNPNGKASTYLPKKTRERRNSELEPRSLCRRELTDQQLLTGGREGPADAPEHPLTRRDRILPRQPHQYLQRVL